MAKRVYVTGGSSGIGTAICEAFAAEGARVAIGASRRVAEAEALLKRIRSKGGDGLIVRANLHSREETDRAADEVLKGLGGLDVFVHSAGIDVSQSFPVHQTTDETWDNMISLHVTAAFRLSKRLIPALLQGTNPSIIFIGSINAIVAWEGDVGYSVAKAGLHHLARCIAADYAKQGLRANVLAPGVIDTPLTRSYASGMPGGEAEGLKTLAGLHPMGRYAMPHEVAGAAVFLASEKASFITGAVLPVDGGLTMV